MKDSIFTARFFNLDMEKKIDGLINCIEHAKAFIQSAKVQWEIITFFNEDEKQVYKLYYKNNMFSK